MVVTKDGDLELYAVYDAPKQVAWSARGDLAIGGGRSHKLIPGFQDKETSVQPWDVSKPTDDQFTSGGWPKATSLEFTNNRRADDGLPFGSQGGSGNGKQSKSRTFSPASFRHYPLEPSAVRGDPSAPTERAPEQPARRTINHEEGKKKVDKPATSKSKKHSLRAVHQIVEDDISMVIRHRVIRGYGIKSVCLRLAACLVCDPLTIAGFSQCQHDTRRSLFIWYIDYVVGVDTSYVGLIGPSVCLLINFLDSRAIAGVPTSRIHGYDFSNQGLMGIWEGFQALPQSSEPKNSTSQLNDLHLAPTAFDSSSTSALGLPSTFSQSFEDLSYGDFNAAVTAMLSRQGVEKQSWSPALRTNKSSQRELALQLCGWYLRDDELSDAIKKYGFVLVIVHVG